MDQQTEFQLDINRALKETLALVLAGGRGSRLMALTNRESKPAVPFGGKYRIIDFPLSNCINSGIRKISVLTQYRAHTLIHHIQRGWNFLRGEIGEFVELWPAQQQTAKERWYMGTADAVHQNLDLIKVHNPRYVLILAGDHIYKQNYAKLLAHHIESGADATVACVDVPINEASGFGIVDVDENDQIIGFLEKPTEPPPSPRDPTVAFASMG
ncbi:MAG: sugar phosphate nucleotidyltransferase, partial [Rhodospirillaceae bacterium]